MKNEKYPSFISLLITIIVLAFLLSCTVTKKTKKSVSIDSTFVEQKHIATEIKKDVSISGIKKIEDAVTEDKDVEITHTEYDTSKPTDTLTGKPPIKSETKAVIKSKSRSDSKASVEVKEDVKTIEITKDSTKTETVAKIETKEETKVKRSFPLFGWLVIGVIIFVVFILLRRWYKLSRLL